MNLELATQNTITNLQSVIKKFSEKGVDLGKLNEFIEKGDFKRFVTLIGGGQISGSLSPFIHTYNSLNFEEKKFLYTLINMEQQGISVETMLKDIENNDKILGSNVTMPYKIDVFKILETKGNLDPSAILVGATNTLSKNKNGEIIGFNTDMEGIILPIKEKLQENIKEVKKGYVLGSGGAARAAISALLVLGITNIVVLARREDTELFNHFISENVKHILKESYGVDKDINLTYEKYDVTNDEINNASAIINEKGIIINTIPFGFKENLPSVPIKINEFEKIKANIMLYFDIVYDMNHGDTPMIKLAKKDSIKTCDGIDMLLNQAVKGFNLWTRGENLDLEALEKIFRT